MAGGYSTASKQIAYSTDNGSNWALTGSNILFSGEICYSVAFGYTIAVACGATGATGKTGKTGPTGATGPSTIGDLFTVAVGNGIVAYSYNGINWIKTNQLSGYTCVAWNGSMWVTGKDPSTIAYSTDGIKWTEKSTGLTGTALTSIVWNGLLWVGTPTSGTNFIYSKDGITWINSTTFTYSYTGCLVAWSGLQWLAAAYNSSNNIYLLYSYDGINWSPVTITLSTQISYILWFKGYWILFYSTAIIIGSLSGGIFTINNSIEFNYHPVYAGGGSLTGVASGSANGTGTAATFNQPQGVALDSAGNIYVADTGNNLIRKITPGGVVTTFAGSGVAAYANSTGAGAAFNSPRGVALDSADNVYVADAANNRIRKITPGAVVTTFAGSGVAAYANATGAGAAFNSPRGVAVNSAGIIYVADMGNHLIRKITTTAVVTTVAGGGVGGTNPGTANGTGTAATFSQPQGVAVDSAGNIYVADTNNNLIRKITSTTLVVTTFAGGGGGTLNGTADGTGTAARFIHPIGLAVDSVGNIYVADAGNNRIRKITPGAVVTTFAGGVAGYAKGMGTNAKFNIPYGITVDSAGKVYVADTTNNLIRILQNIQPYYINAIETNNTLCVAAGNYGIAWSPDGLTWTMSSGPFNGVSCLGITWNGSVWICITAIGTGYSYDGMNWFVSSMFSGVSGAVASRILQKQGQILGTPYTPAVRANWPTSVPPPTTIGQALDLIVACFHVNQNKLPW